MPEPVGDQDAPVREDLSGSPDSSSPRPASPPKGAPQPTPLRPVPRTLLRWLTYGVAGTVLFPIIDVAEGATRPEYDAMRQAISALSLGPGGWVQQAAFALCGISVLWLAFVWRRILSGGVCAVAYPLVRAVEGVALVAIAVFSQDPGYGYPPGTPAGPGSPTLGGTLHLGFTILVVQAMTLGLLVIAWRLWRTPGLRGWALFSLACAVMPMALMPLFVLAQNDAQSSLAGYAGLFERLATSADTIWGAAMLIPLWSGRRMISAAGPGTERCRHRA